MAITGATIPVVDRNEVRANKNKRKMNMAENEWSHPRNGSRVMEINRKKAGDVGGNGRYRSAAPCAAPLDR